VARTGTALDAKNRGVHLLIEVDSPHRAGIHTLLAGEAGLTFEFHPTPLPRSQGAAHAGIGTGRGIASHTDIGDHLALESAGSPHPDGGPLYGKIFVLYAGAGEHAAHAGNALVHLYRS